ncbi:hypothetical protein Drose_22165 [Dactylosporangium roseum]|uniref:Uncharacterized protein n=1 Tax=Dactylosporangium roseum TaxID=47989 RepID=A0ABY5YW50_9ACTN|nr:hypothetical protein [Dactylosporangium roseum]UWZ33968.1 hypothetical protein Drose_22165 [Dactylosporangium roseum]
MPTIVEVLVIGARDGRLHYRCSRGALSAGRHPDGVAADLVADTGDPGRVPPPLTVLHSTSWRHTDGGLVLTYAAVTDGNAEAGTRPVTDDGIVSSGDPARPSPASVPADAVATHAARHLAWLRATDDAVATALAGLPHLWHCFDGFRPGPAGAFAAPLCVSAAQAIR